MTTMRMDISLPTLFRATPNRAKSLRSVYCSRRYQVDVPELSSSETEIAFRLRNRIGEHLLRAHAGRLFRPVVADQAYRTEMISNLQEAFCVIPNGIHTVCPGGEMSRPDLGRHYSPVQFPIECHHHFPQLSRGKRDPAGWPAGGTAIVEEDVEFLGQEIWVNTRNRMDFDAILKRVSDPSQEDLATAFRMNERQLSKLVLIDGEPWCETRPPCVRIVPSREREFYHVGFFPEWLDHWIEGQYVGFGSTDDLPLGQRDGTLIGGEEFEIAIPEALAFDASAFAARRMATTLSSWCVTSLDAEKDSPHERIDDVLAGALAWNEILEEGDEGFASDLGEVVATWKALQHPIENRSWQGLYELAHAIDSSAAWLEDRELVEAIPFAARLNQRAGQAGW